MLEGFSARSRLWTDTETRRDITGGASASWSRAVGRDLSITATVELARSFCAVLDADPTPRPDTALRTTVALTRHFGGHQNDR